MSSNQTPSKSSKKLKQACLPFKLVNSPGDDENSKCRKRKLSGTENNETRVENSKFELLNGGAKCFIKSDQDEIKKNSEEICGKNSSCEENTENFVSPVITSSDNNADKTDGEIIELNTTINEKSIDIDSTSVSSDSDQIQNDISVNSNSDGGTLEKTPSSKKANPKRKKQESAKKTEERLKLKLEKEKAREEKLKEQAEKQRIKEQKRLAEIEAKRLREMEKEKERKQKEEEKKQREEEKKAKELEKERERKQKEEEKKAKELEKEREKKQKEEERKAKELEKEREKKQKEEERKAKELEKEKLKEEKLLKEEMERKKNEKVKAAFVGFFRQKSMNLDTSIKDEETIDKEQETYFMPFQTKQDMKIAPFCRAYLTNDKKKYVDKCIGQCEQKKDLLYLNLLKTGNHKPSKSEATWPVSAEDDEDVIIIETGADSTNNGECSISKIGSSIKSKSRRYRWKLLQFDENKRPPYWGTWRKKSLYIKPKRPFACDKIMFDYDVDSDDEWEEEDPGESIHGTDNEEEPEDDYEVDNDVFVPHGYLSDEEGQDNDNDSEEAQKEKLKLLGEEFEAEIKKKTERIKPKLVGCIWIPNNVTDPQNMSKSVADTLLKYRCIWEDEEPIITEAPTLEDSHKEALSENKKTSLLPDSIIPDLITFIHGNTNGIKLAVKKFVDEHVKNGQNIDDDNLISLSTVRKTIKTIATKSTHVSPWSVSKENFEKYGMEYPKNVEVEVPKPKSAIKKITSFMTPQNQKTTTLPEKVPIDMDKNVPVEDNDVPESDKGNFIPKNLFNVKESRKPSNKEEHKVKIVDGKKRITPILLSPKKNFKLGTDKKSMKRSLSPEIEIVSKEPKFTEVTIV